MYSYHTVLCTVTTQYYVQLQHRVNNWRNGDKLHLKDFTNKVKK